MARWTVLRHPDLDTWVDTLDDDTRARIKVATRKLAEHGPGLGRPLVDSIKQSRHSNMKELRSGTLRILFAFDPRRQAILLIGGDKRGKWETWYKVAIPIANDRFDQWLKAIAKPPTRRRR